MSKTGWQNPWVRAITTILAFVIMIMIFCFSMETADQSDRTIGRFSRRVVKIAYPQYDELDPTEQKIIYDSVQHAVRKCAHFTEYMMLGFVIRLCLESWFGYRLKKYRVLALIGFGAGTAYACTDELHQLTIEGRSGQWTDVMVDGSGVLIGVVLGTILIKALNGKLMKQPQNQESRQR